MQIHENAFGYAKNIKNSTEKIHYIEIQSSHIKIIPKKLLPWARLDLISIMRSTANCDPENNWIFTNKSFKFEKYTEEPLNVKWCKY